MALTIYAEFRKSRLISVAVTTIILYGIVSGYVFLDLNYRYSTNWMTWFSGIIIVVVTVIALHITARLIQTKKFGDMDPEEVLSMAAFGRMGDNVYEDNVGVKAATLERMLGSWFRELKWVFDVSATMPHFERENQPWNVPARSTLSVDGHILSLVLNTKECNLTMAELFKAIYAYIERRYGDCACKVEAGQIAEANSSSGLFAACGTKEFSPMLKPGVIDESVRFVFNFAILPLSESGARDYDSGYLILIQFYNEIDGRVITVDHQGNNGAVLSIKNQAGREAVERCRAAQEGRTMN